MAQTIMHNYDDTRADIAIKTTNLALKSIVGHEVAGYNKTLGVISDTNKTLNTIVGQNRTLNNIIKNLTVATQLLEELEVKCCRLYKAESQAYQLLRNYNQTEVLNAL